MSRAWQQAAWRALQWLPLLGACTLLLRLPAIVQAPLAGIVVLPWRLDALTLLFLLSLATAIALLPLSERQVGMALILAALLAPAMVLEHLLALPAALLLTALLLRSRRWLLAALLLSIAVGRPYATAGAGWNDAPVAASFTTPVAAGLLAAVFVVLAPWPWRRRIDPLELGLLPIWLLPLLRAIGLQPWRPELGLLALIAGCGFAVWSVALALRGPDAGRPAVVASGWLAFALAATGLLTTVGVAAALYGLLAYPLGLSLLLRAPRLAAPLPLTAGFVSAWLAVGAVAAAGAWLAAAALLLAALGTGVALVIGESANPGINAGAKETKPPEGGWGISSHLKVASFLQAQDLSWGPGEGRSGPEGRSMSAGERGLLAASWALGVAAPPVIGQLILPAVDLLQGGLSPFGLLAIWPWIGVAALDAGQRRVATLPTIALPLLTFICAAGAWIVARMITRRSWRSPSGPAEDPGRPGRVVGPSGRLHRVWWLGGRGDG